MEANEMPSLNCNFNTENGKQFNKKKSIATKEKKMYGNNQKISFETQRENVCDGQLKWFNLFPHHSDEILEMKEAEQNKLFTLCKDAFVSEMPSFKKQNPSDWVWLQTALSKGTAKDRANAGALLVTSNPLGNLENLATLITFSKTANKICTEVVAIITHLWKNVLLPPHRKIIGLTSRGADWKLLEKDENLTKEVRRKVYAYWYFENGVKEQYFAFLKILQQGMQYGQECSKNSCIIAASQLLIFSPEKEQMLLTMLINKLGDPVVKTASKALHHLTEVAYKHPDMAEVLVTESEKLLFRNNISDRTQHITLCFLASVAYYGPCEICTKLINICFSFFKVMVKKGAINNRIMQAILRCLQKSISEVTPISNSELLSKDMQDTIYRLVHLSDIRVSIQTLGLLLQINISQSKERSDRFYNALYKRLLNIDFIYMGTKAAAQLLYIVHRAIYVDSNVHRALAFIKRLLQLALHMPTNMSVGCLIVVQKLVRNRRELISRMGDYSSGKTVLYSSPIHDENKINCEEEKTHNERAIQKKIYDFVHPDKYNPFYRVPGFARAENAFLYTELLFMSQHFHPTVQLFSYKILNRKKNDYYGDPLRDFGIGHFLERFAFKNPKNVDKRTNDVGFAHKIYKSFGMRGKPLQSLTKFNCSEEEMFIFNYLEEKRKTSKGGTTLIENHNTFENGNNRNIDETSDIEFTEYLNNFFGTQSKRPRLEIEENLNLLKELTDDLGVDFLPKENNKKETLNKLSNVTSVEGNESYISKNEMNINEEENSIKDLNFDKGNYSKAKISSSKYHSGKVLDDSKFLKKLKNKRDMSSLFADADEFSEVFEETKSIGIEGTSNVVFNKDKSSLKQLLWEKKRHSILKKRKLSK